MHSSEENRPVEIDIHSILTQVGIDPERWYEYNEQAKKDIDEHKQPSSKE